MAHRGRWACLVVVCTIVAAACSGASDDAGPTSRTTPRGGTVPGPGCQYIVAGEERRFTTPLETQEYLVEAIAQPATCYDRITFTFDQGDGPDLPPAYSVEYREAPFGLEGIPTSTDGLKSVKAVLYVEIAPASAEGARLATRSVQGYKGNLRLQLKDMGHTEIVEWVDQLPADMTPDDVTDNKVVWLIGLSEKVPFTVDAANQPPRVSVLVMNDRPRRLTPDTDGETTSPTQVAPTTTLAP